MNKVDGIQSNGAEIAFRIFSAIELLKLQGNRSDYSGEGIPVRIVLTPDFVVDADGAAIKALNDGNNAMGAVSETKIGSRAGRVLHILSQFRDIDDEGIQLSYICKTGATGRAVLVDRMVTHLKQNNYQPIDLKYLTPGRHTRVSIYNRSSFEAQQKTPKHFTLSAHVSEILSQTELETHFYAPLNIIHQCNVLYFATDTLEQFSKLVDCMVLKKEIKNTVKCNHDRYVILDLSAIHDVDPLDSKMPQGEKVSKLIKGLHSERTLNSPETRLCLIVENRNLTKEKTHEQFKKLQLRENIDLIICYSPNQMYCYSGISDSDQELLDLPWSPHEVYGREGFTAGFILYMATLSAWREAIATHSSNNLIGFSNLSELPKNFLPESDNGPCGITALNEAIQLGFFLGGLWKQECYSERRDRRTLFLPSYKDLIKTPLNIQAQLANKNQMDWCCLVSVYAAEWQRFDQHEKDSIIALLYQTIEQNTSVVPKKADSISHEHRSTALDSKDPIRVLFALRTLLHLSVMWSDRNRGIKTPGFKVPPDKAYLTDLDGTLLTSSDLRRTCLRRLFLALLQSDQKGEPIAFPLIEKDMVKDVDYCAELYEMMIYKKAEMWEKVFNKYPYYRYGTLVKDFRTVWNHPLSYPTFMVVLKDISGLHRSLTLTDLLHEKELTTQSIKELGNRVDILLKELLRECEDSSVLNDFLQKVTENEKTFASIYEKARLSFWDVVYHPFTQICESLRIMRDILNATLYVVTEGHDSTQVQKISVLKLADFFPRKRILSTGAASESHEMTQTILNLKMDAERKSSVIEGELAGVIDFYTLLSPLFGKNMSSFNEIIEFKDRKIESIKSAKQAVTERINGYKFYSQRVKEFIEKENIYKLIIASIIVDPIFPYDPLTDLGDLVLKLQTESTSRAQKFAMIGDSEKKDVKPILDIWGNSEGSNRIRKILMPTVDHSANGSQSSAADYLVQTPLQAVLILSNSNNWSNQLSYSDLPPIFKEDLLQNGALDFQRLEYLALGKSEKDSCFHNVNFLLVYSTFRRSAQQEEFIKAMCVKLAQSRSCANYGLLWECTDWVSAFLLQDIIPLKEKVNESAQFICECLHIEMRSSRRAVEFEEIFVRIHQRIALKCMQPNFSYRFRSPILGNSYAKLQWGKPR